MTREIPQKVFLVKDQDAIDNILEKVRQRLDQEGHDVNETNIQESGGVAYRLSVTKRPEPVNAPKPELKREPTPKQEEELTLDGPKPQPAADIAEYILNAALDLVAPTPKPRLADEAQKIEQVQRKTQEFVITFAPTPSPRLMVEGPKPTPMDSFKR